VGCTWAFRTRSGCGQRDRGNCSPFAAFARTPSANRYWVTWRKSLADESQGQTEGSGLGVYLATGTFARELGVFQDQVLPWAAWFEKTLLDSVQILKASRYEARAQVIADDPTSTRAL